MHGSNDFRRLNETTGEGIVRGFAHEMRQIAGVIVEQLTTLPGSEVTLRLEIDAEVPSGLDRNKVRTLMENANTLGFIDKVIK